MSVGATNLLIYRHKHIIQSDIDIRIYGTKGKEG